MNTVAGLRIEYGLDNDERCWRRQALDVIRSRDDGSSGTWSSRDGGSSSSRHPGAALAAQLMTAEHAATRSSASGQRS